MKSHIRDWAKENNAVPTVPHWPDFITSQGDLRKSLNLDNLGFDRSRPAMVFLVQCHPQEKLISDERATQPFLALALRVDNFSDFTNKKVHFEQVVQQDALTHCPCAGDDQLKISAIYIPPAPPAPKSFSFTDMMPARAGIALRV